GSVLSGNALASVTKVLPDGKTELVIEGLSVGHPAGVALSKSEGTLYVSGFDAARGTDVVFTIDLASKNVTAFTDKIVDFTESAGLHRARSSDTFAWADS